MSMRISRLIPAVATIVLSSVGFAVDQPDPRTRTFVYPKRIVWHTKDGADCAVANTSAAVLPEKLLDRKHGQVCETRFARSVGTKLVNKGAAPGVILDFGRELHGGVQIGISPTGTANSRIRVRFGESVAETLSAVGDGRNASNDHALRDFELPVPLFGSIEVGNTGFRFLRLDLVTEGEVGIEFVRAISLMRPMARLGWFKSSDARLNEVFDTAVRTVHLCCQEYLWDGIKRDRLVWMGDIHPEARAIFSVFGAADVLRDTLDYAIATTPSDGWMNAWFDTYTAWFLRVVHEWYLFTGDTDFVRDRSAYLKETIEHVLLTDGKNAKSSMSGFLDWPTHGNKAAETAGAAALWAMAFDASAELAVILGDGRLAERCRNAAASRRSAKLVPHGSKSAAALLALSGMRPASDMFAEVLGRNGHDGVSTFYGYYMIEAMEAAGEHARALDTVRDYWGAMLDMGATSFWEDFAVSWTNNAFRIDEMPIAGKKDIHGEYGQFCYKGFRHSLCHGWSAGPAAWCINRVLGIRSLSPGCGTVEVKPSLEGLDWAEGAMALPCGETIKVRAERTRDGSVAVEVSAPDKIKIIR